MQTVYVYVNRRLAKQFQTKVEFKHLFALNKESLLTPPNKLYRTIIPTIMILMQHQKSDDDATGLVFSILH